MLPSGRSNRAFKSGLSSETKSLMKQRDNLNSKMKHLHGDQKLLMHLEYKKARNRCSTLQRSDTIKNNVTKFSGLTNPKDTWRAAKAIITPRNDCGLQLMVGDELIQEESRVAMS
jgi:hypothetical protein